jgi:(S)-2-hydroxyglutarate dehydrogenase
MSDPAAAADGEADVAIIGAGILGLAVATALVARRPALRLVVLEREARVAAHQTGHNSGVIHSGVYYRPGSLKARLCVEGARRMYAHCDEHGIATERCGKLIVATAPAELPLLAELEERGRANGVPGLRRIAGGEIAEIEPHVRGLAALHLPQTGIVDYVAVARSLADGLGRSGVEVAIGTGVEAISQRGGRTVLRHRRGELVARGTIVCAGGWADTLAPASEARAEVRIVPFRGQYLMLRPEARHLVRALVYPVPDTRLPFLGVHLTKRIDGELLLGPSALMAGAPDAYRLAHIDARSLARTLSWPGTYRVARRWWRTALDEIAMASSRKRLVAAAARFVPELESRHTLDGPAGVRAQAVGRRGELIDDFLVAGDGRTLHVRNAPSPAATSSLALADLIVERAEQAFGLV